MKLPRNSPTGVATRPMVTRYGQRMHIDSLAHAAGLDGNQNEHHKSAVTSLVDVCFDAMEQHRPQINARDTARQVIEGLKRQQNATKDPLRRRQLATLGEALAKMVVTTLYPRRDVGPQEHAKALLEGIASAAQAAQKSTTITQDAVITTHNAMLGPVLHTGDEIWSAAAALIKGATKSVRIQTWAYHRRSESARHIMGALAQLQLDQAQKRDRGDEVIPIEVEILLGSGLVGWGKDALSGGKDNSALAEALANDRIGLTHFNNGIFPFAVDPALMKVSFHINEHKKRGAIHSKTLIIDDEIGMVTSANIKGSHNRANNFDAPFHDFGSVFGGPFVNAAMLEDFKTNYALSSEVGSNHGDARLSLAQLKSSVAQAAPELNTVALQSGIAEVIAAKVAGVVDDVLAYRSGSGLLADATLVAISKAPVNALWRKAGPSPQRSAFLAALNGARTCIEINNTNFNADEVVTALKQAMRRGVSIDIMSSEGCADTAYAMTGDDNRSIYRQLAAYHAAHHCSGDLRLRWHPDKSSDGSAFKASHTKAMFIDQVVAIIGSANLDAQSWTYSGEFNVATHAPNIVKKLRDSLFCTFWEAGQNSIEFVGQNALNLQLKDVSPSPLWPPVEVERPESLNDAVSSADSQQTLVDDPLRWKSGLLSAASLHQQFKKALSGTAKEEKLGFVRQFYRDYAPRLRTEEAALERLVMRENRLALGDEHAALSLFIENNVLGETVSDYAPSYVLNQSFVSKNSGARAALYVPDVPPADAGLFRAIVAYEGVTFRPDGEKKARGVPVGLRDAFDPRGVGRTAFAADKEALMAMTQPFVDAGMPVTLTGFSLGGAMAGRHFSAHSPDQQKHLRLITFAAPGLDRETVAGMGTDIDARHFRTRHDLVTKVGQAHLPGLVFKSPARVNFPSWRNHTHASLSDSELNGARLSLGLREQESRGQRRRSSALEFFRQMIGYFPLAR